MAKLIANCCNVNLSANSILISDATDPQTLVGVENFDDVTGTGGDDTIVGDTQSNILNGGAGIDTITSGGGDDLLTGGADKDILTGGANIDFFDYRVLTDSLLGGPFTIPISIGLLSGVDAITGFTQGTDQFLVGSSVGNVAQANTNNLIGLGLTLGFLGANNAVQITSGSQTFVVINNGTTGYNPATDAFIELISFTGTLTTGDFTTAYTPTI